MVWEHLDNSQKELLQSFVSSSNKDVREVEKQKKETSQTM